MKVELKNSGTYNLLKVEASYSKGGINYWNYKNEPKGMYVHISAVEAKFDGGFYSESFMVGGDDIGSFKMFLFPMNRNSKKKVAEANAVLDGLDGEVIAKYFEEGNKKAIADIVYLVFGIGKEEAA